MKTLKDLRKEMKKDTSYQIDVVSFVSCFVLCSVHDIVSLCSCVLHFVLFRVCVMCFVFHVSCCIRRAANIDAS